MSITFQVTTPTEVANNVLEYRHISDFSIGTGSTQIARGDHTHSPSSLGAIPVSAVGIPNGLATLDSAGKIPVSQIPTSIIGGGGSGQQSTVISVNNKTGIVNLSASDVGAAALQHNHSVSQVTGLQAILDAKASAASTLAGYGITDSYTKSEVESRIAAIPSGGGGTTPPPSSGTVDNYYVNLSQYNYPYNVSTATLNATLATLSGKCIIVDKLYECTDTVTSPEDSWLIGATRSCGFKQIGSHKTLFAISNGTTVENLVFDGNKSKTTGNENFGDGLVRKTGLTRRVTIRNCIFKDYRSSAVYMGANFDAGTTFVGNYIENTLGGWFSQRSNNLIISNNVLVNVTRDGIKVHGKDGTDKNYRVNNVRIENNLIDLKTLNPTTIPGNLLCIELWGNVDNFIVGGNTVIAPNMDWANGLWGISIDASKYGIVENNYVDGGPYYLFSYGLEAAGNEDTVYIGNTTVRCRKSVSISQPTTRCLKIINNVFERAKQDEVSTIQFLGGINEALVEGNTFRDFGRRGIHFNGVGTGTVVSNNFFYIRGQTGADATCIYSQGALRLKIIGNTCGPEFANGVTPGTTNMRFLESDKLIDSLVSGNYMDGMTPAGVASTASAISPYGDLTGGNIIENNFGMNYAWVVYNSGKADGSYIGRNRGKNLTSGIQKGTTKDKLVNLLD